MAARWTGFGQPRNCCFAGGACPDGGATIDLGCAAPDGGDTKGDANPDASANGATSPDGGCGCSVTSRAPNGGITLILLLLLATVNRPRRC